MQKVKTPNQRPSSKMVYSGSIPSMARRRTLKRAVLCTKASWCWWVQLDPHFLFFTLLLSELQCFSNELSSPLCRSSPRKKTQRSAWRTNTSYMRICCRLLPTTMFFWLNLTPTSGHWRAGLSAQNPVEEVSECIVCVQKIANMNIYIWAMNLLVNSLLHRQNKPFKSTN